MTDVDHEVVEDEVDFSTEMDDDDEAIDFEHLTPENGMYEVELQTVLWQNYVKENGDRVRAVRVAMKLVDDGGEFDGSFINHFIYLGRETLGPIGRKQFKNLCESVGVPCEGTINVSSFQPSPGKIGKFEGKVLGVFSGLRCGADIFTKTDTSDDGTERINTYPKYYVTLERLEEIQNMDLPEEF